MKGRFSLGLTLVLCFGCGQEGGKNSSYNSSGFDAGKDEAATKDTAQQAQAGGTAVTVKDLAWLIDNGTVPEHLDEATAQQLIDGLADTDPATRQLHARAITKLWHKADGAVAESMGLAGLEYVYEYPSEFIALFDKDLPEMDLSIWADMLAQEILIDGEDDPLKGWRLQVPELERMCATSSSPHRKRLGEFVKMVSDRIHELIKAS